MSHSFNITLLALSIIRNMHCRHTLQHWISCFWVVPSGHEIMHIQGGTEPDITAHRLIHSHLLLNHNLSSDIFRSPFFLPMNGERISCLQAAVCTMYCVWVFLFLWTASSKLIVSGGDGDHRGGEGRSLETPHSSLQGITSVIPPSVTVTHTNTCREWMCVLYLIWLSLLLTSTPSRLWRNWSKYTGWHVLPQQEVTVI